MCLHLRWLDLEYKVLGAEMFFLPFQLHSSSLGFLHGELKPRRPPANLVPGSPGARAFSRPLRGFCSGTAAHPKTTLAVKAVNWTAQCGALLQSLVLKQQMQPSLTQAVKSFPLRNSCNWSRYF